MNAVGYVRVSTEEQAASGVSLEAQRARIEAWMLAHGVEGDPGSRCICEDAGISGSSTNGRPGLAAALDLVTKSGATLVVYSLSRLARSTRDALDISERLKRAGANLVSLTEQIDTTTAMGTMFFTIMAAFATLERDLISERTRMALAHKRSKGERVSARIPFGYDLQADGKHLLPNEAEQGLIVEMRSRRAAGEPLRAICDDLEARGIKTKTGSARWNEATVWKLTRGAENVPQRRTA